MTNSIRILRRFLRYEEDTGFFFWIKRPNKRGSVNAGDRAGQLDGNGYRSIQFSGGRMLEHRLALAFRVGHWPDFDVDHKNRVRDDNRFDNLRPATRSQNAANSKLPATNSSGYRGVSQTKNGRWAAKIQRGGKQIWLGSFADLSSALEVYKMAAKNIHGEYVGDLKQEPSERVGN